MSGRNKHAFFTKLFPFAKIRNIFKRHKNSTPWILEDPFEKGSKMDLVSWIFGNRDYDQDTKIYIDPENAERSISANEARATVRKFVAGWKAVGLKPGDCVCVHAFNDVRATVLLSTFDRLGFIARSVRAELTILDDVHHAFPGHHRRRRALHRLESGIHIYGA